jgi:hypothetical protein
MVDTRARSRLAGFLAIFAISMGLPACQSPGWAPSPSVRSPDDGPTSRFSLRPILDGAGYRPYYVGGYAGASYGPGLFGRSTMFGVPAAPIGPPNVTVNQGTWSPQ